MGMEVISFLVRKKINRYPDFNFEDLRLVKFRKSECNTEKIRINLILPMINRKQVYGGISTALNFFYAVSKAYKAEMRIIVIDTELDAQTKKDYPKWNIHDAIKDVESRDEISLCSISSRERLNKTIAVRKNDYFIATSWKTKYVFEDIRKFQWDTFGIDRAIVYLIQDYEPGFYAWSSDFCLAESTYKGEGIIAVFNSLNLKEYFNKMNYSFYKEYYFDPVLNASMANILTKTKTQNRKMRILFYGRPFEQRNCFSLGVEAIRTFIKKYNPNREWEFISIGAWHKDIKLEDGFVLHSKGKMSLEEYAELLLTSRVGISLMCSPHPSYPPLEMATFGLKTVTNSYVCKNLEEFSSNILSVDRLNIEELADAISRAVKLSEIETHMEKNEEYITGKGQFDQVTNLLCANWN